MIVESCRKELREFKSRCNLMTLLLCLIWWLDKGIDLVCVQSYEAKVKVLFLS